MRPWIEPKLVPATVTDAPVRPESGDMLLMFGDGMVKLAPALATPLPEVTTIFPLLVNAGTEAPMLVSLQLVIVAAVLLMVTVPEPWVAPKFVPLMVIAVPAAPDEGNIELIAGMGRGVTVIASLEVLNFRVTLWRLAAVFLSRRIPVRRSVFDVVKELVTRQLNVRTAAVL